MFRLPDLTHVVIVAGDSDYVPLAQRCKRLGRYVVGVGVAGSTAKSLAAACDEFEAYDSLPGVPRFAREPAKAVKAPEKAPAKAKAASSTRAAKAKEAGAAAAATAAPRSGGRRGTAKTAVTDAAAQEAVAPEAVAPEAGTPEAGTPEAGTPEAVAVEAAPTRSAPEIEAALNEALETAAPPKRTNRRASSKTVAARAEAAAPEPPQPLEPQPVEEQPVEEPAEDPQETATRLLERALRLGHDKNDDSEWLHSSAVKTHMRRMDPSFSEKALGYRSFNDFVKARESIAELEETGHERLVRLRE
jgi:hypothetical protein